MGGFGYYVLLGVGLAVMLAVLGMFVRLRRHAIVAARRWEFSIAAGIVGMVHFAFLTLELAITLDSESSISCHFLLWPSVLFVPMFYTPFFLRSFHLLFQHHYQKEKAESRVGWFTTHRHLSSLRLEFLLYFGFAGFFLIIAIITQFSTASPEPFISTNSCLSKQIYLVLVEALILIIAVFYLIYRLWDIQDAFYVKKELRLGLAVSIPTVVVWGIFMIGKAWFPPSIKSSWFVMVAIAAGFSTMLLYPVVVVIFRSRRIRKSEQLRREKRLNNSNRITSTHSFFEVDRLKACIADPELFAILKVRCQRAWCIENLLFFKAVFEFSTAYPACEPEVRRSKAMEIYENYVRPESNLEVNLDMGTRELILESLNSRPNDVHPAIFDDACKTVTDMLKFGIFREWSLTPEYDSYFGPKKSGSFISGTRISQLSVDVNDLDP